MPHNKRTRRYQSMHKRKARGKSKQSATDRRQNAAISKLLKQQYRLSQYKYNGSGQGIYQSYPLVQPNLWEAVFQSNFRANNTDRCFIQNMHIITNMTVGVSGLVAFNPFHYCIFIVSLKKEARLQTIQRLSPLLTNPQEDIDYTYNSIGLTIGNAQWRLNPAIYNVHAVRRGMIGDYAYENVAEEATPVTTISDANKNHRFNIPWKRRLKRTVGQDINGNPLEWKDMTVNEVNPADQLYMLFFNNATADQSVDFAWSLQANTKVPQ